MACLFIKNYILNGAKVITFRDSASLKMDIFKPLQGYV